jgi:signal transduction histidine kinase
MMTMSSDPVADAAASTPGAALPLQGGDAQSLLARMERGRGRGQQFDRRHPWVLDSAVVLLVVLISLPELLGGPSPAPFAPGTDARGDFPAFVPYAFAAAFATALWWRRRHPAAVFFIIAAIAAVQWTLDLWQPASISILIALCTLASRGPLRALGWAVTLAVVEAVAMVVLADAARPLLDLFFLLGTVAAAAALGLMLRIHRMYVASLEERTRRFEIERDQRERLTAAAERTRIAREMHDILGHNLSVMVTLADGAATLAEKQNEPSAAALRMLGDTGREAMDELRRVLGVLRESGRDPQLLSPQPGIGDLDALLSRVRSTGLTVTCQTSGHLDELSGGVQLTVYRIVQEALTNTLKHAGNAASAAVTVSANPSEVRIRIADTGTGKLAAASDEGREPGHGLIGIRQRAALYGGTVILGPRRSGSGWIVDVVLERSPAPAASNQGATPS